MTLLSGDPRPGGGLNGASGGGLGDEASPYPGEAPIRVGLTAREQVETRWGLVLVVFMRLLAVLWIIQGLLQWSAFMVPHDDLFDHLRMTQSAAVMFFSVIDFLAAVGLWLATPWGGVLWLFAAISQIFVAASVRQVIAPSWIASDVVLIVLYFALTFQAGRPHRGA